MRKIPVFPGIFLFHSCFFGQGVLYLIVKGCDEVSEPVKTAAERTDKAAIRLPCRASISLRSRCDEISRRTRVIPLQIQ